MSTDDFLEQYASALAAQAAAENQVKLLEMQAKLQSFTAVTTKPQPETVVDARKDFIGSRDGELEPDDLDFLQRLHRSTQEVGRFRGLSESEVKRRIKNGTFETHMNTGQRGHRIDTISVVKDMLDGKTEEEF